MAQEIRVALFKDVFWNNNSESYPTTAPDIGLFTIYKDPVNVVFISPYEGWVILEGDYNFCLYGGNYYQLKKIRLDDINKRYIKYQLIYDIMMNFIKHGGTINGNVIRTNNIQWLDNPDVLQTTVSFLENPSKCIYGSFNESEFSWIKDCKISYPSQTFEDHIFTETSLNLFIQHINENKWVKRIKDNSILFLDGDTYIYAYLPTVKVPSWKNTVIDFIKKELSDLSKFAIAIASQLGDSVLKTHKCLTYKDAAIGSTESSNIGLKQIDLSGLKDIKPITFALTPDRPRQKVSTSILPQDKAWHPRIDPEFIRKISRLTHLPLKNGTNDIEDAAYLPLNYQSNSYSKNYFYNTNYHEYKGNRPQKVLFKEKTNITSHTGYLWNVDRLDFALVCPNNKEIILPKFDGDLIYFTEIPRENLPPVGFLLFDHIKEPASFKFNQYISDFKRNKLSFRTGISDQLIKKYGDVRGKWWENISPQLASIRGAQELSFHALETDLFSWLYFAPKANYYNYQYHHLWDWDIQTLLNRSEHYTTKLVLADIPNRTESNPFNKDRIKSWLTKRYQLINDISIYSDISLKYELKKGDIFTTSLSSRITSIKPNIEDFYSHIKKFKDVITPWSTGQQLAASYLWTFFTPIALAKTIKDNEIKQLFTKWYNNTVIADLTNSLPEISDMMNNTLVLYSFEHDVKLGIFRQYSLDIPLSDNESQIVETVDNKKVEKVTCYHIQTIEDELAKINNDGTFSPEQKTFILAKALEAIGLGADGNMMYFNQEFLEKEQQLFDLEGTDWYVLFKSGHIHLISKTEKDFFSSTPTYHTIDFKTKEKISLLEKINQKAILSIYGNSKALATKFHLNKDEFDLHTEIFDIKDKESATDYIQVICENPYDYINEITQIPKKTLKATASISIAELENIKHQIRVANQNEFYEKAINRNLYDEQMRYFQRRREDLRLQIASEVVGTAFSGLSTVALGGVPMGITGAGNLLNVLFKPALENTKLSNIQLAKHSFWTGRYGSGLLMAGGRFAQSIPTTIGSVWEYGRVKEDEKAFMEKTNYEIMMRENKYSNNYAKSLMDLNRTTTSYIARDVNDRDILLKLKEQGKPEIHLQLFVPTPLQLKKCEPIFDLYGVECYIPNKELVISNGMDPQIIQFDLLNSDGVLSEITTDSFLNEHIRFLFMQGIIFVKHHHIPIQPETIIFHLPKGGDYVFDITKITEWSSEEWDRYIVTAPANKINETIKKLTHYGLTEEEYNQYKDEIDPNNPLDAVNKIISNRGTGISVIIRPKSQHELDIEVLEKKVADCNAEKEKLKTDLTAQINECNQEKTKLQTDLTSASNRADTLSKNVKRLEGELTQEKNLKNLLQAEVNQMRPKIQTLETEKTHLNEQVTNLTQALEQCRVVIPKNPYDTRDKVALRKMLFFSGMAKFWWNASYDSYKRDEGTGMVIMHGHFWITFPAYYSIIKPYIQSEPQLKDINTELDRLNFKLSSGLENVITPYESNDPMKIDPTLAKKMYNAFMRSYEDMYRKEATSQSRMESLYRVFEILYDLLINIDSYNSLLQGTAMKNMLQGLFNKISKYGKLAISVYTYSYFTDDVEFGIVKPIWAQ